MLCAAPVARASDVELLKTLYAQRGQTVVSPLSLNLALMMAAEGARGETRAQLLKIAGLTEEALADFAEKARKLEAAGVRIANAAFVKDGLPVLADYDALLADRYQAERFTLNEDINGQVNAWVKEKTEGLIDQLLSEKPDENLMLMLVNALALKADWRLPFAAEDTYKEIFHALDGDVDVDFMHKEAYMPYMELPGFKAVRLSYADSTLGLTVVLPDGSIADALDAISALSSEWDASTDALSEVNLALPKLSAADSLSLVDALKALGVTAAFDKTADFSGIDGEKDLFISSILQRTRLDIDEKGTTAAAATSIGFSTKAAPLEAPPIEFKVDRPFILLLTDGDTGLTLFAAAIDKP